MSIKENSTVLFPSRTPGRRLLFFIALFALVALQWITDTVEPGHFLMETDKVRLIPWLESPFSYFYLHAFTVLPVLALSFDRNVHYYRKWKALFPAILGVGGLFIAWDAVFTQRGVWGFNHVYLTGWEAFGLPVEEWLFFLTVPFACVFIYECLNFYIKPDLLGAFEKYITLFLIVSFTLIGVWHWSRMYTATTFLLTAGFLLYHYLFEPAFYRGRFYLAYLVILIPFLVVNGVLTGGYTKAPIVIYNPDEYLGLRITSVPADDVVYGFLLVFMVVSWFERRKSLPKTSPRS